MTEPAPVPREPLFRSPLRRLRAQTGKTVDLTTRREFLAASLAASAALVSSCGSIGARANGKRVVVIGGGFAGLACAYELMRGGYDVQVLEARNQVGGRVRSVSSFLPGRNLEFGAELIGSNHPTWVCYQQRFGLEFLLLTDEDTCFDPFVLGGRVLTKAECEELEAGIEKAFGQLDVDGAGIDVDEPWNSKDAAALDARSTKEWLDELDAPPEVKLALGVEFRANNGQELERQSYLGNLVQVMGGGGAKKYRAESEVFRCKGGNQSLAFALAKELGGRVKLGMPVHRIEFDRYSAVVHCKDGRAAHCDDVVLAVPPSVWDKIEFDPALPTELKPQMGLNVKFFGAQKQRIWDRSGSFSQYGSSDGALSMTWEGTDRQQGDGDFCLVGFAGAHTADALRKMTTAERDVACTELFEKLLPGSSANATGKTAFMDWPSEPWTKSSYSFPAPGEVTTVGPRLRAGLGALHFAGEHTCYKFVGYMEGALNSGASLAQRLAIRDGVIKATAGDESPR